KARDSGSVAFEIINPRDFCYDQHHKVDDTPFGGHPGMLIKAEPVALAIEKSKPKGTHAVVITEPSGKPFTQRVAKELASFETVTFVCGHYEGIDHRVEETFATHVLSIGDYVLTNGELPALVMTDAIVRLQPGVLGNQNSLEEESFENDLLAAPNYTRPEVWRGKPIPEVLKSGNHKKIDQWRAEEALKRTEANRPDLLTKKNMSQ
ncbi:MAG TPA: tRNA (guanosine(37)-N1)-methyltransferase TrmD, partial [Fimbriimonas sp.]|nr:tRNA (guanosine(37)-N1)-methyltransferase TrmD [Fimbriimonas sp.]